MKPSIAVIGGGAAGFFSSISIAENSQYKVVLLEKSSNLLSKLKISGGGRCNVTHHLFDPVEFSKRYPRGSRELQYAFQKFGSQDTVDWFQKHGVKLKAESDGRMFPVTDRSETIIECLVGEAKRNHVDILIDQDITSIRKQESGSFQIEWKNGDRKEFHSLVLATGSSRQVWKWLQAMGHRIVEPVPSIFTFKIQDPRLMDMSGVTVPNVGLNLPQFKIKSQGPLLVTHWGLSGPAILRLSAWAARELFESGYKADLTINFLPDYSLIEVRDLFTKWKKQNPKKTIGSIPSFIPFPKRYWENLLNVLSIPKEKLWSNVGSADCNRLADELGNANFSIEGRGEFKEEFVTAGGIHRKDVNFSTMESKIIPGLYFAGEILDVDGITGGFNFQNAWTTAWIAAESINKTNPIQV